MLTRDEQPLHLWAVVGEATLRKNIGGPEVMRAQPRHVVRLCRERPNKYSADGNNCVEVMLTDAEVLVRNSNRHGAGTLAFTFDEWRSHIEGHKRGAFDLSPKTPR